jgi:glycosyltransferase involved in cell wall biosynthesis
MVDALVTHASRLSADAAHGLVRSSRIHHPHLPAYVVAPGGLQLPGISAHLIPVEEIQEELNLAVTATLDPDEQPLFALPFALERVLQEHSSAVYVSPGCLLTRPLDDFGPVLEEHSLALVSPFLAYERFSTTPHLVNLTRRLDLVSPRLLAIRSDAKQHLEAWQATMVESFFDVWQRRPGQLLTGVLGSFVGVEGVAILREAMLTTWVDYAAIESGRGIGSRPAVVVCDELWRLGREAARREGDNLEVAWQLLADRVHDSRPLEPLVDLVNASVEACPSEEDAFTPFHWFSSEVRRAADPTGARWPVNADPEEFLRWLYEQNAHGLTRIAHLYWQTRPDLQKDYPNVKLDPRGLQEWNDRRALAEFGMDLFDPDCRPRQPSEATGLELSLRRRLAVALLWRFNVLRGLVPGYAARQEAKGDLSKRRGLHPPRREEVRRTPGLYGTSPRPLTVIGCFRSESGLGQAARASLESLRLLGRPFSYIDTSEEYPSRNAVDPGLSSETFGVLGDVNLVHSNADELITLSNRVFRHRLAGRFNVGVWFWEAADLPTRSRRAFDVVDELWVASNYLADVFGQYGKVPVKVIGLAADLPEAPETSRSEFGLSDNEFVFLFVYDALSAHGRKNPEKALEAFAKAFAPDFSGVRFVLKVSNLNKFPASQSRIRTIAERYPAVTLIDGYWSRDRVLGLMSVADVYVSLHAAEGYGLTLLEAMALGSPVICTGYSGNVDFTTTANSWLVDYRLIATKNQSGPYPAGSVWASPDIDSAADLMRWVRDHPTEVDTKRRTAMADARKTASLERYAQRLDQQLSKVL